MADIIMLEIELLYKKMLETNLPVDPEFNFSKVLYALVNGLSKDKLFNMTDEELIQHIRKVQVVES